MTSSSLFRVFWFAFSRSIFTIDTKRQSTSRRLAPLYILRRTMADIEEERGGARAPVAVSYEAVIPKDEDLPVDVELGAVDASEASPQEHKLGDENVEQKADIPVQDTNQQAQESLPNLKLALPALNLLMKPITLWPPLF